MTGVGRTGGRLGVYKRLGLAAAVGFWVPVFWGVLGFVWFCAPQSAWTDVFWYAVYVTCPFWLLPENGASMILTPTLNAIAYALATLLWTWAYDRTAWERRP